MSTHDWQPTALDGFVLCSQCGAYRPTELMFAAPDCVEARAEARSRYHNSTHAFTAAVLADVVGFHG